MLTAVAGKKHTACGSVQHRHNSHVESGFNGATKTFGDRSFAVAPPRYFSKPSSCRLDYGLLSVLVYKQPRYYSNFTDGFTHFYVRATQILHFQSGLLCVFNAFVCSLLHALPYWLEDDSRFFFQHEPSACLQHIW